MQAAENDMIEQMEQEEMELKVGRPKVTFKFCMGVQKWLNLRRKMGMRLEVMEKLISTDGGWELVFNELETEVSFELTGSYIRTRKFRIANRDRNQKR